MNIGYFLPLYNHWFDRGNVSYNYVNNCNNFAMDFNPLDLVGTFSIEISAHNW